MTTRVILNVIGSDRPGLTQALADAVLGAGGNWLESHLSRLGGKFVGAVLVELDDGKLALLEQCVRKVDASGLQVAIAFAGDEVTNAAPGLSFELVGQDRPGIVREVTSVLAALGVNIEDFTSATEPSAHSGGQLFRAGARLSLPDGTSPDQVRDALEAISGEIMVDVVIGG